MIIRKFNLKNEQGKLKNKVNKANMIKLKAYIKSGSVYLSRNVTGINGTVRYGVIQPDAPYSDGAYDRSQTTPFGRSYEENGRGTASVGN